MRSTQLIDEQPWRRPWWQYSEGNGAVLLYIVAIHSLALAGLLLFPLPSLRVAAMAVAVAWIGGVGTTVCYHEPMSWVANHRHHHAKADTEEDVSSPRHGGFWWAHIRWVYQWSGSEVRRWCPDMDKPRYRFWRQLQIPIIALSIFGWLAMGWEAFFWIGAIRLVYALHFQMFVNSLLHMTPGLPEGVDSSRNIWWLGPLQFGAWGENWHRNHHADANAARFGRRWWQIDLGWLVIRALVAMRLATDVKPGKEILIDNRRKATSASIAHSTGYLVNESE